VNGERRPGASGHGGRGKALTRVGARASRARGFSLLEVIAVIALIALAIGVVTLSFSKIFTAAKVQAASRDLVAALRYTRGQAIVKGKEATFDLDLANNSYHAPGRGAVQLPKTMRLNLHTAMEEQTSETSGSIRFYPDGASTGGHISVLMDRTEWRINVDWLTGGVTREELKQ
jgi:general secretion pathway protein H